MKMSLPHISKQEESKILEENQFSKLDSKAIANFIGVDDSFKSRCLKMIIPDHRDIHKRLMPV
jgi:hypothetical protein